MILTSCELPNQLLGDRSINYDINDYDFVLYHLFSSNSKYRDFYTRSRTTHPNRITIFDNSAYEYYIKGECLNMDEFRNAVSIFRPTFFILPDVLMDKNKTLDMVKWEIGEFYKSEICRFSIPIAVIQGNSIDDMLECVFTYKALGIKAIALPFHNSFLVGLGEEMKQNNTIPFRVFNTVYNKQINKDMLYALGRIRLVEILQLYLKSFNHIHLLGSHCPLEKMFYSKLDNIHIRTIDTGYPVKCAVCGYELFKEPSKPNIIIDDIMNKEFSEEEEKLIINNVKSFKNL